MDFIQPFFAMDRLDRVRLTPWMVTSTKRVKEVCSYLSLMTRVQTMGKIMDSFKGV